MFKPTHYPCTLSEAAPPPSFKFKCFTFIIYSLCIMCMLEVAPKHGKYAIRQNMYNDDHKQ